MKVNLFAHRRELKIGDRLKGDWCGCLKNGGVVTRIGGTQEDETFTVTHTLSDGSETTCKHQWNYDTSREVEIITNNTIMKGIVEFFRSTKMTDDDKLLKEMGIEDPVNVPTPIGRDLLMDILHQENRSKLIDVAKQMKVAQEADTKK